MKTIPTRSSTKGGTIYGKSVLLLKKQQLPLEGSGLIANQIVGITTPFTKKVATVFKGLGLLEHLAAPIKKLRNDDNIKFIF
jgi:hypothetical protein